MPWFLIKLWFQLKLCVWKTEKWIQAFFFLLNKRAKILQWLYLPARVGRWLMLQLVVLHHNCICHASFFVFVYWDLWLGVHDSCIVQWHSEKKEALSKAKSSFYCISFSWPCSQQRFGEIMQLYIRVYFQCQNGHSLRPKLISFNVAPLYTYLLISVSFIYSLCVGRECLLPSFYRSGILNPLG